MKARLNVLKAHETYYRAFLDGPVGMLLVSAGELVDANRAACEALGWERDALPTTSLRDLLDPVDASTAVFLKGETPEDNLVRLRRSGSPALVGEVSTLAKGEFIVGIRGVAKAASVVGGPAERSAEEGLRRNLDVLLALRESGKILRASSLKSREAVLLKVLEVAISAAPLEAAAIKLRTAAGSWHAWRTTGDEDLLYRIGSSGASAARERAMETGEPVLFEVEGAEDAFSTGMCLPLRARGWPGGVLEACGPAHLGDEDVFDVLAGMAYQAADALENARLYQELADRERQLQELVGRLFGAQEEERRRVAYEVHDGLAQVTTAAHQRLQAYASRYPPASEKEREDLERVIGLMRQTAGEARRIIADLRPAALDDLGLAAALSHEVDRLREDGWEVDYQFENPEARLPAAVETTVFRVAQEALTNARKHAGTTGPLQLQLRCEGKMLRLSVRDRGRGFQPEAVSPGGPGEKIGLSGMRERVSLLGGRFRLHSQPGEGTLILAELPLPNDCERPEVQGA